MRFATYMNGRDTTMTRTAIPIRWSGMGTGQATWLYSCIWENGVCMVYGRVESVEYSAVGPKRDRLSINNFYAISFHPDIYIYILYFRMETFCRWYYINRVCFYVYLLERKITQFPARSLYQTFWWFFLHSLFFFFLLLLCCCLNRKTCPCHNRHSFHPLFWHECMV